MDVLDHDRIKAVVVPNVTLVFEPPHAPNPDPEMVKVVEIGPVEGVIVARMGAVTVIEAICTASWLPALSTL
jgi:hypothetical protein